MSTYTFKTNINCMNCITTVTPALNSLDNVDTWRVDTESDEKILTVSLDDENAASVLSAVKSAGFEIEQI